MKKEILLIKLSLGRLTGQLKLLLVVFALLSAFSLQAQSNVKGKVSDDDGTAIPGVNVLIKGTTQGTATDSDGNYSLTIPDGTTDPILVFSFIGYTTQEQSVGGRAIVDVKLVADTKELSEVVVVGYGTQNKRDITGAILKVNQDVLLQTASPNAIDQLKGHAAGVDITTSSSVPGGESTIRIRGNRTMVASTPLGANTAQTDATTAATADGPLLVVDGIPYNGNLNDISPNDIASMEILKDASATAIYGSRGSGGVVLITTKRGVQGKTVFSYDGYYGTSKVMKELKVFNGTEYAQFKADAAAGTPSNTTYGYNLTPAEQAALSAGVSTDWQKLIYKDAPIMNHNLSVSGGSDKSKYSMGANYFKQGGIIPNQDYSRGTIRLTLDNQLSDRIKVGVNSINTLSYQNTPGGGGVTNGLMRLTPLASPYNPDGTVNLLPQVGSIDANTVSPLTLITNSGAILNRTRRLRTFNSLYGEVNIIKGLKYRANIGLDYYQDKVDNYSGPNTWVNTSPAQSASTGNVRNTENWQYTVENLLIYEKTLNEKHKIGVTGLYSFQKNHTNSNYVAAIGVPLDQMQTTNFYAAYSVNPGGQYDNYQTERGLISYMGRVNYSFEGRFSATATFRTDGSSVLSPGNQYYSYPAFGAAWNITNEKFMTGIPTISNLKLRAGWGVTANQNIAPYSTLGGLSVGAYNFGQGASSQNAVTINYTSLPNTNLKWQNTKSWNIGLDFGVIENRITGAIEVYSQETSDILLPVALPISNGASTTYVNAGKTKAHGLEISLNTINIKKDNGLLWTSEFNYFFNREEIVALANGQTKNIGNGWFVGQPLTVIYDYQKVGIWQTGDPGLTAQTSPTQVAGQIKVLDWNTSGANPGDPNYGVADNKITIDDQKVIGNFQPKFDAGFSTKVEYKRFDFSISFYARMGMKVVVPYVASESGGSNYTGYNFFNSGRSNQLKVDYWTPNNPTNNFPQPTSVGVVQYGSTLSYVDGSFIKCRAINLGYSLPPGLLGKTGITSLRVYVSAVNPFVLWAPFVQQGYGPDPEGNGYGGGVNSYGTSYAGTVGRQVTVNANNPSTRQFMVGLNLKF
jgi:TonB-linked SusC/RagA family outer membrane protein